MNAPALDPADLDRRTRLHAGCVPPDLVAYLLDHGHADTVHEWALDGEWFCARARARLLGAEGRQEEARSVLAPYVATGWWTAVAEAAGLPAARGGHSDCVLDSLCTLYVYRDAPPW
ncbi:hypothetical protein [Streptomyces sp. NPDC058623]|uniref:hypothetical protein n=1 Tax=Streptomyces sp. NPDC058623 TaxID=3346563 RepID=UPI0036629B9A